MMLENNDITCLFDSKWMRHLVKLCVDYFLLTGTQPMCRELYRKLG